MFHLGLDRVITPNILLIMIDYFIMQQLNDLYLRHAYEVFYEYWLDWL